MDAEQLRKFLKDNLKIDSTTEPGRYGMSGSIKVSLVLEEEEIDYVYLDIPKDN